MPDYDEADTLFQAYLDLELDRWGKLFGLKYYKDYYALMTHFNEGIQKYIAKTKASHTLMHEQIKQIDYFFDICHFTQEGMVKQAESFFVPLSQII